ncbi:MAG: GNAT family N-acetyltransferase [Oscillospiraceae bacterium]|nr:GNAT family N-acetyltransferase [Oscillospiraceae bacterium]
MGSIEIRKTSTEVENRPSFKLTELQPSQFYISEKKLREINEWFRPEDRSNFEPIPVKLLDRLPVMTDGHTRAVAALLAGLDAVPLVWDADELDWDMYRRCVEECRRRGVSSPADLLGRVISEMEYGEKWDRWCDEMHAEVMNGRTAIREAALTPETVTALIRLSEDWEAEGSCYGYRKNTPADIEGNRIFLAEDGAEIVGYLFGHKAASERASSIMPEGTPFFEVEELYVKPEYRRFGIGRRLFVFAEQAVSKDAEFIMLSTATKNWKAILHFYLEELDMKFWSARLFKKLR